MKSTSANGAYGAHRLVDFNATKLTKVDGGMKKLSRDQAIKLGVTEVEKGKQLGVLVSFNEGKIDYEMKIVSMERSKITEDHPQFVKVIPGTNCCIARSYA